MEFSDEQVRQLKAKLDGKYVKTRHANGSALHYVEGWRTIAEANRMEHLRFVARQPCLICGRTPAQAHHIRYAQPRGLGIKVSDEFTVPLCAIHHSENHATGDERRWWGERKIDPLVVAERLWRKHALPPRASPSPSIVDSDRTA
jgi:hypothetical protein